MEEKDAGWKYQLSLKLGPLSPKGEPLQMLNVRANDFTELTEALRLVASNAPEILAAASAFKPAAPAPVPAPAQATTAPLSAPAPQAVPVEGSGQEIGPLVLERVNVTQGTGKTGKPYTRFQAVFGGGVKASTFDQLVAGVAQGLVGKPCYAKVTKGNYGYELDSVRAA